MREPGTSLGLVGVPVGLHTVVWFNISGFALVQTGRDNHALGVKDALNCSVRVHPIHLVKK